MRDSGAGPERRYRWDELGRLTEVAAGEDGQDARAIDAVVNAPGEVASVDGTAAAVGQRAPAVAAGLERRGVDPRRGRP
jgi:hypothetical protein